MRARRCTNGHTVQEEMLNITNSQRNANQNHNFVSFRVAMSKIANSRCCYEKSQEPLYLTSGYTGFSICGKWFNTQKVSIPAVLLVCTILDLEPRGKRQGRKDQSLTSTPDYIYQHARQRTTSLLSEWRALQRAPFIGAGLWNEELDAALGAMCSSVVFPF